MPKDDFASEFDGNVGEEVTSYPIIPKAMSDARLHEIHDFLDTHARVSVRGMAFGMMCELVAEVMYARGIAVRRLDVEVKVQGVGAGTTIGKIG